MSYFLFETRKKIGFDQVLGKIKPQSPYGRDRQDQVRPLNAADLQAEFERLSYVMKAVRDLKPGRITELKTLFSRLPVMEESLGMLEAGATLHDIALFTIRKFMVLTIAIEGLIESRKIFLARDRKTLAFSLPLVEKMRARETEYSFSIGDFAPEELKKAQKVTGVLKQREQELRSQKTRHIRDQLPQEVQDAWYDEGISVSKGDLQLLQQGGEASRS
jgi:hypothetical protein